MLKSMVQIVEFGAFILVVGVVVKIITRFLDE